MARSSFDRSCSCCSKRLRILHVIPQFPYFGGRTIVGGHASCLLTLSLAQAAAGHDVTVISYVHGSSDPIEIEPGLRVHPLFDGKATPGTIGFGLSLRRRALRWVARQTETFDVVHCHSGFADYFLVSAALKKRVRCPVLHTMYCPIPADGGRWQRPVIKRMINTWAAGLDGLTAMSHNVGSSMTTYGMSDVRIVPPAVDIDRFHAGAADATIRTSLDLSPDDVVVLFVGNAKPQKNLSGVLDAFHRVAGRHPAARLVITTELAQSSTDDRLRELRRQMQDLDLEDRVRQMGIVDDMPSLMRSSDLLIAPFVDSFGPSDYFMAALEAMAAGKPVIVSAVGGMPEVISDEVGRLVDPNDVDSIANALDSLLGDADLRHETGRRARSYTEHHFDPSTVVGRYDELYANAGG